MLDDVGRVSWSLTRIIAAESTVPLQAGARLGPYEILSPLGIGGMGEVYRARDTNLKRQVAIKVLPDALAGDAERLARFQREAELVAALNHPNIAQIFGLEKAGGTFALVMELVEGPTLADRIVTGVIPLDEALPIARQIAEALEGAHEQGIVHRDLKPANVKVRPDGTVKVLDFSLAKAMEPAGTAAGTGSNALTHTTPAMTQPGVILWTAAYMSPEQTRGRPVDRRTDIWAFGCVLYEMLAGHSPFSRETLPDTTAAVLESEPDWLALPAAAPPEVRRLLRRCLDKDPRRRLRDIGEARLEITSEERHPAGEAVGSDARPVRSWDWFSRLFPTATPGSRPSAASLLLLLVVLSVVAATVLTQYRQNVQKKELRQTAESMFYELRALEGNLVRLRRLDPLSSDIREAVYRRNKLTELYDGCVERLGLYDGKSETETAVLRMARRLGEADLNVPVDFVSLTLDWVQRWLSNPRFSEAIARARERGLTNHITKALDEKGLPRELLFLILRESEFNPSTVGPRGAPESRKACGNLLLSWRSDTV